jgi:hypothetical protein
MNYYQYYNKGGLYMKRKILPLALCAALLVSCLCISAQAVGMDEFKKQREYSGQFTDIVGKWHEKYISELYEYGIAQGRSDDKMAPTESVTVAEIITLCARINATYYGREIVQEGVWYSAYVDYAVEHELISTETAQGEIDRPATRGESAQILSRALPEHQLEAVDTTMSFTDVPSGSEYYKAVSLLAQAGVVQGYGDNIFAPEGGITRAEAFTMAARLIDKDLRIGYIGTGTGGFGQSTDSNKADKVSFRCNGVAVFTMDSTNGDFLMYAFTGNGSSYATYAGLCEMQAGVGLVCHLGDRVIPQGTAAADISVLVFTYDGGRTMTLASAVTSSGAVISAYGEQVVGNLCIGAVLTANS